MTHASTPQILAFRIRLFPSSSRKAFSTFYRPAHFSSSMCLNLKSLSVMALHFMAIRGILNNNNCNKIRCHYRKLSEKLDDACYLSVVKEVINNESSRFALILAFIL
jgi:hypothetical protein